MKSKFFILPFIALLIVAVASAAGSAFQEITWLKYAGWGIGVGIIALWVSLDWQGFRALLNRKGAKYGASSGLTVLLGLLVIIGLGFLSNKPRFNKSYDATRSGANTLSDQSMKIIKNIDEKKREVQVTAFFQDKESEQKFRDLVGLYNGVADVLRVEFVDPQQDPTKAISLKITSGNTVILKHGPQESRITTFTEEKLTNALVKIQKDRAKKVYFTMGHGEGKFKDADASGYQTIVTELENNLFEVEELSIIDKGTIPEDADLVVIAGPKYDFQQAEIDLVDAYLAKGGALMVMADALAKVNSLNGLLMKYGITFNEDLLILNPNDPRAQLFGQNNAIVSGFDEFNPVTKDFAATGQVSLIIPNTRSLSSRATNDKNMKVDMVATTSEVIIKVKDVKSEADLANIGEGRIEKGTFDVIAVATGKTEGATVAAAEKDSNGAKNDTGTSDIAKDSAREIRIMAVGSSQFATNLGAQRAQNRDLFMNATNYLVQDEDFISIRPKDTTKSTLDVSSASSQLSLLFFSFIYPFVFLGGGVFYWLRRRRL